MASLFELGDLPQPLIPGRMKLAAPVAAATLSAANSFDVIVRAVPTGAATYTTATAADIVAAIGGDCEIGTTFMVVVINASGGAQPRHHRRRRGRDHLGRGHRRPKRFQDLHWSRHRRHHPRHHLLRPRLHRRRRRVRLVSLALHLQPCHQAGLFFYPSAWIVWASTPSAASAPKKPPPPNHPLPHPHWIAPPPQLQTPNQGAPARAM
jgi:hypothetical protein